LNALVYPSKISFKDTKIEHYKEEREQNSIYELTFITIKKKAAPCPPFSIYEKAETSDTNKKLTKNF
jgi:hypothetical protein